MMRRQVNNMVLIRVILMMMMMVVAIVVNGYDTNVVYSPCSDAVVSKGDGFTIGVAFSAKDLFFFNETQLSPCDKRLGLADKKAQLAVFRPKVDEISLLSINNSAFDPVKAGGYMVAFAGQKYAARSQPIMVADDTHTIPSFTLVLEFREGTLINLFWKQFGCGECSGGSFVCIDNQFCGVANPKCKSNGGTVDCDINVQLAFSGTDRNLEVLNSWYEVKNLRQNSLYDLYSSVSGALTGQA